MTSRSLASARQIPRAVWKEAEEDERFDAE